MHACIITVFLALEIFKTRFGDDINHQRTSQAVQRSAFVTNKAVIFRWWGVANKKRIVHCRVNVRSAHAKVPAVLFFDSTGGIFLYRRSSGKDRGKSTEKRKNFR